VPGIEAGADIAVFVGRADQLRGGRRRGLDYFLRERQMNFFGVDLVTYLASIITVLFFASPTRWFLNKVWNFVRGLFGGSKVD
jgi:hypothetical protein